jgi:asparagine synthase (glutamine-hydrolysing)
MASPDGRYWITFNGEIYNFQALRTELQHQGETFTSHTDTEVLLKLYQRYGGRCLDRLRGMYALAIWDEQEQYCFMARDPLGIKPLYYWHSGTTFIFASELLAVMASGLPAKQLNPQGLLGYLLTGSVPEPHTLIEGIHCLPAGQWLSWHQGTLKQQQYWQINFQPASNLSAEQAIHITRHALLDSVRHHFISDVPVGFFLSGGIDSSSIVALATQVQSSQLRTYSIAFEETEWNEGELAQRVANHFGMEHTEYKITAKMGRSLLPHFLESIDQPSIDGFNTFCVAKIAHELGTKVVLSGLGGDELFGGYRSFQMLPKMARWGIYIQTIPFLNRLIGQVLTYQKQFPKIHRLADFLLGEPNLFNAYTSFRGIFSYPEAIQILQTFACHLSIDSKPLGSYQPSTFPSAQDEVSYLELSRYMRNQLLRDSDVMSMQWGLELRVPLVDRVLLEAIAKIPSHLRLEAGKQILIKSIPELPDWLLNRPKRGFFFPYSQWMETEWQDYFSDRVAPVGINLQPWYRRWSLFILKYWWNSIDAL